IAAALGARVALIERGRTGGDCLWTGCVPSKTLIATAAAAHTMRTADQLGLTPVEPSVDFAAVMRRVRDAIAAIEPQDSVERLRDAGVEVISADARFTGPHRIRAGDRELRWRAAIIATGSEPVIPSLEGLSDADPLTTDTVWHLDQLPARLLLMGGGPVGCELAQAFARLGAQVTIVETASRLLLKEEPRASDFIREQLEKEGIDVRLGAQPRRVTGEDDRFRLEFDETDQPVIFDRVLIATGRRPRTEDLELERAGVATDERGAVQVDARLRTTARSIYAVGDVTGAYPFTHVAAHHARVATPNALFHARGKVAEVVPWTTFTDPEVAHVGLSEEQARERWGERAQIAQSDYGKLDRAITAGQAHGFARLIGDPHGRLVGATVCAPAAGEAIAELTARISRREKIAQLSRTVHAYPTLAEGPARAASAHLAARYCSPRVRAIARPVLGALRVLEGAR
ncbi:MAG: dihydrolipoyl dehydrogenase family protein, partial [Solirubrobacteraceae bacterium]